MPLNVQRRKLLLHPVIDTFVMIKYNSYAVLFLTGILMRLLFSLLITGLTVNYPINVDYDVNKTMNDHFNHFARITEMNETTNPMNARPADMMSVNNNTTAFN